MDSDDEVPSPSELVTILETERVVTVSDPSPAARREWRQVIHAILNNEHLPDGAALRHTGRDKGDIVIRLLRGDEAAEDVRSRQRYGRRIPIPERLTKPHAAVATLKDNPDRLNVSRALQRRALLLLQGLIDEAERRGYAVEEGTGKVTAVVVASTHRYSLTMREVVKRTPHVATDEERRRQARGYFYIPHHDEVHTGQLEILLPQSWDGLRYRFADRQRFKLEDVLSGLLDSIGERVERDDARQRERDDAERARREADEAAIARARERFEEAQRVAVLDAALAARQRAHEIRGFCTDVSGGGSTLSADEQTFLKWAALYADSIDPVSTGGALKLPTERQPTPAELEPFLDRRIGYDALMQIYRGCA